MIKKIVTCAFALMIMFSLNACTVRNVTRGMEEGEHYDAVVSVKGKDNVSQTTGAAAQQGLQKDREQLAALMVLLGKTEEEAVSLMGEGTENRTADGSYLIGRNYKIGLFEEECNAYSSYDEDGKVGMVFVELPGTDIQEYEKQLEALFGIKGSKEETDTETEGWQWNVQGCVLHLYEADGAISLDLVLEE